MLKSRIMNAHFHPKSRCIAQIYLVAVIFSLCHCTPANEKKEVDGPVQVSQSKDQYEKLSGIYSDTFSVTEPAAIFFYSDSLQLQYFKQNSTHNVFEATIHESESQINNAKLVLNKFWTHIKVIELKKYKFILCKKTDGSQVCLNLDKFNELSGLFLFDPESDPLLIDMMNIDSELDYYFNKK